MNWHVIERRMAKGENGHKVELPGTMVSTVLAPDRTIALRRARALGLVGRVEVVAECSWQQMSHAERDRLLGNFVPPAETKETKGLRKRGRAS